MNDVYNLRKITFDMQAIDNPSIEFAQESLLLASDFSREGMLYPKIYELPLDMTLIIGMDNRKLTLQFTDNTLKETYFIISFSPYIRLIREYKEICSAYKYALMNDNTASIETIDMARRGLHNQAADLMQERLNDKLTGNHNAFRYLFSIMTLLVQTK